MSQTIPTIELYQIPVAVDTEWEDDDDGCGDPSTTGNHMTGRRGRRLVVTAVRFDGTAEQALKLLNDALEGYDTNLLEPEDPEDYEDPED